MVSFKSKILILLAFAVLVVLLLRLYSVPGTEIISVPATEINVIPANVIVEKGKEFSIDISIDPAGKPVSAAQFNLIFNGSVLKVRNITEGSFFKQNGGKTAFKAGALDNNKGTVTNVWGLILTPGADVTAKGTFVTIIMYADNIGNSKLDLTDVIIINPKDNSIPVRVRNGTVNVRMQQ